MSKIRSLIVSIIVILSNSIIFSSVPQRINFQGRLLDANKNPRNGSFNITFSIWDTGPGTGGTQIWSETQTGVQVVNGMFSVQLGAVNPISPSVFTSDNRWLQIQIGSEILEPRERLVTSPYTFRAATATYAESVAPHTHNATEITAGTLSSARGGTGISGAGGTADRVLITTDGTSWTVGQINPATMIASGTLPDNVIASSVAVNAVGSAQIINNTITNEDINSAANISWAKISKIGSSLGDLATRSASDINSGLLSAHYGGTGIYGAGGNANRVLVTTNGTSWIAGLINPATMIGSGTLPNNVIASSVAVNAVGSPQIVDGSITDTDISETASISWTKISKAGSSLGDLATRSASDINSGNLDISRMPTGGNWNITNNLSIAGSTFVITTSGNIGIGTNSPTAKLDIIGQIRIAGGSPGSGKFLTSDSSGLATWAGGPIYMITTVPGAWAATAAKANATDILVTPLYIPAQITVNQMRVRVTTALGAAGDVGIYRSDGTLVLNGGNNSLTTTVGLKTITPSQTGSARILPPGQYYVAITWNSNTGVIAGASIGVANAVPRGGTISGGGSVLPTSINLDNITAGQYLYGVILNE